MPLFSKESLEALRQRVDLAEVLSSHLEMKRSGASYKALCPFHDEKNPSFMIQKGDTHYHCFGCGAHGDAIQFLMMHLKMSFSDAVESLAQRFNVPLQIVDAGDEKKGPNKSVLKEALEMACRFFHLMLLHTEEGHQALEYLYQRGIDLDFIQRFRIGLAPREPGLLRKAMHAKFIKDDTLGEVGLISPGKEGGWRDFFYDRITIPICEASGAVIGFSARKYKEATFGGKYVNTPETPLFKKSRVLFGLNYCRRRIAKERKALIVEGQIDALRLINNGFNITVAGQGTAFGESHAKELIALGISQVYLAFDSDEAGQQATYKVGDMFQKEGVEVRVLQFPKGSDPDSFFREKGPIAFLDLMHAGIDYLTFAVNLHSANLDMASPAGKNELVQLLTKQVRAWNHPLMVHESLRTLAHLMKVPESLVGVGQEEIPNIYIKKFANIGVQSIDPEKILESDFLRWLVLLGNEQRDYVEKAKKNLSLDDFHSPVCRQFLQTYLECYEQNRKCDITSLAIHSESLDVQQFASELMHKKVKLDRGNVHFEETIQKILNRNWMKAREAIRVRIQSGQCTEEELMLQTQKFDELKRSPPVFKA